MSTYLRRLDGSVIIISVSSCQLEIFDDNFLYISRFRLVTDMQISYVIANIFQKNRAQKHDNRIRTIHFFFLKKNVAPP